MKKAFLWFVFLFHTLAVSTYIGMSLLGYLKTERLILILLSISGILTTLTFAEYVLKDDFQHRSRKRY